MISEELLKFKRAEFLTKLRALISLAGGSISEDELKEKSVDALMNICFGNNIGLEVILTDALIEQVNRRRE